MSYYCPGIGRGAVENEARDLKNRDWEKRGHQTVGDAECETNSEAPFIWTGVAVEPPVRFPCRPDGFPEREFYFGAFCLAHNGGDVAGADNSVSIASITACVEIWFIGNRGCLGTNSVNGEPDVPCKINAGLSCGRQWNGLVGPKRITCGVRDADARCIGAESTVINKRALLINAASVSKSVLPERSTIWRRTFDLMSLIWLCSSGDDPPVNTRSTS